MVLTTKHFIDYADYGYVIEKRICKEICWELIDDPEEYEPEDEDENEQMNNVIIEENITNNMRYLMLPIRIRTDVIMLENKEYTLLDILKIVYDFYHNYQYSYLDLKKMSEDSDIVEKCVQMKNNDIKYINPIDLIGDHIYFEGITIAKDLSGDTQYEINFGS